MVHVVTMVDARGVRTIGFIMIVRQNYLPMKEGNVKMSMLKDLLAPKEPTSAEIRDLVDEWVKKGGKITKCAPSVALNYRAQQGEILPPSHTKKPSTPVANKTKKKKK
jgi:hypothetical protein